MTPIIVYEANWLYAMLCRKSAVRKYERITNFRIGSL